MRCCARPCLAKAPGATRATCGSLTAAAGSSSSPTATSRLPAPTSTHQAIFTFLYELFRDYLSPLSGVAMVSALRIRIREGKFREPDILLLRSRSDPRYQDRYWLGADLVAEVVSPDGPERDLVEKRADYAEGGIPEYWIVDPRDDTITVLTLKGDAYVEHGVFRRGAVATSSLLEGFTADVSAVFDTPEWTEG